MQTTASQRPPKNILSFPAEKIINDNFEKIQEKNIYLDQLLKERNQIQGIICKFPVSIKRVDDMEKKAKLDQRYELIEQEILKAKRFLKEFRVTKE
jgi:hypothetical protein